MLLVCLPYLLNYGSPYEPCMIIIIINLIMLLNTGICAASGNGGDWANANKIYMLFNVHISRASAAF